MHIWYAKNKYRQNFYIRFFKVFLILLTVCFVAVSGYGAYALALAFLQDAEFAPYLLRMYLFFYFGVVAVMTLLSLFIYLTASYQYSRLTQEGDAVHCGKAQEGLYGRHLSAPERGGLRQG